MVDLISAYWVLLVIVAAIGAATGFWILSSRRHVELPPIEIGQSTTQTLARTARADGTTPLESAASSSPSLPPLSFAINTGPDVEPDDLLRIKGVGPKLARILINMGVTKYSQIAAFTPDDVAALDARLGVFSGRIVRDNWVEQARFLAAGDVAGFEARFGSLLGGKL
jgi:predicted flap endonuclease-1-like 5' DNA nuclease